jgi:hypothetical protein
MRVLGNKLHGPAHGYGCDCQDDSAHDISPRYSVLSTVIHREAGSKRNERASWVEERRGISSFRRGMGREKEIFLRAVAKPTICGV